MKPFRTDGSVDQISRARLYCVCGCEHFLYDPMYPRTHVYALSTPDDKSVILVNYVGTGTLTCVRCGTKYKLDVGCVSDEVEYTEWARRVLEDVCAAGG